MSSALHAVVRGPILTGLGYRPFLHPAHHALRLTGIRFSTCGKRSRAALSRLSISFSYCVCAYDSVLESMIRFLANQIVPMGIPVSPEISAFDFCQSMPLQSILRRSLGASGGNSLCPNAFLRSFIRMRLRSAHSGEQHPYP